MCVLTEVSQAGESGGLQRGVVGESLTGSHCDPLDAVQHQDVVVTLYSMTQNKRTLKSILICQLANTLASHPNTAVLIVWIILT